MSTLSQNTVNVKNKVNGFILAGMENALQGCNIAGPASPPSGVSPLALFISSNIGSDEMVKSGSLIDTSRGGLSEKPNQQNLGSACLEDKTLSFHGSDSVPTGLDGLDSTNYDKVAMTAICKDFDKYIKDLEGSEKLFAHIKNEGQGLEALVVIDRVSGSRYFPEGRAKIRRKIQKRIKRKKEKGIYLVFTVDSKLYSLIEAWDHIWEFFKLWHDAINVYRKRNMNAKGSLSYVAVLEQHKSGYPHLNVFFPGLRVLVKQKDFHKITEWWQMGGPNGVEVERERKPQSVCSYVLKYVSKMEGWSKECFAILWHYRIRLWNMSHSFYNEKEASGWILVDIYKSTSLKYLAGFFGITIDILPDVRFILINSS